MTQVHATISRRVFELDTELVERSLLGVLPEPLGDHYVVVGGRRFPPKQVLVVVTGLDRADFNTHQARRVLSRLGFTVGRRSDGAILVGPVAASDDLHKGGDVEALRPFIGKWVAQRGIEVLVAADDPQAVLAWLEQHNQRATAMFRVPTGPQEASGVAPT